MRGDRYSISFSVETGSIVSVLHINFISKIQHKIIFGSEIIPFQYFDRRMSSWNQ